MNAGLFVYETDLDAPESQVAPESWSSARGLPAQALSVHDSRMAWDRRDLPNGLTVPAPAQTGLALPQTRSDAESVAPALDAAHWAKDLHQSRTLMAQGLAEGEENRFLQKDAARRERQGQGLALVGLAIALLQVGTAIVQTTCGGQTDVPWIQVVLWMVVPLLVMGPFVAWWTRRLLTSPRHHGVVL